MLAVSPPVVALSVWRGRRGFCLAVGSFRHREYYAPHICAMRAGVCLLARCLWLTLVVRSRG